MHIGAYVTRDQRAQGAPPTPTRSTGKYLRVQFDQCEQRGQVRAVPRARQITLNGAGAQMKNLARAVPIAQLDLRVGACAGALKCMAFAARNADIEDAGA